MSFTKVIVTGLRNHKQRYPTQRRSVQKFGAVTMSSDVFSSGSSDSSWRGVPLSELYGSQSPWGAPEFPLVSPGHHHAVLYHIPGSGLVGDRPPKPQIGHDKWDQEHVRMPCSTHSLYPVENSNGESRLKKRWEIIEHALWRPIRNSKELADTIVSYNTKFKSIWKFRALHKLFDEYLEEEESQYFFDVTLPEIAKLALALPKLIQSPIPLLKQNKNSSISLSQQQIASLLANAFFCTFPRRNTTKRTSEYSSYPFINFNRLYESSGSDHVLEKLKCICHYFRRVCTKVSPGVVTFSRRCVRRDLLPAWPDCDAPLAALRLHVDPHATIEQADGLIQVDFANRFLGGGVLNHGCVQEEIRFVVSPELLVSMLFTEQLAHNEALLVIGTERYSTYAGYGHTFQWSGDYKDMTPLDSSHRRRCAVLAIDALPYRGAAHQYRAVNITRELNKAWIGFSFATDPSSPVNYPGVATGNWGCGAFGGTPQLKSLLQMMACTQARRPMAYYTFKDMEIRDDVVNVYNLLARYNVTVGQLYKYIIRFSETSASHTQLHAYLHQVLRDGDNKPTNNHNVPTNNHNVPTNNHIVVTNNHNVPTNTESSSSDDISLSFNGVKQTSDKDASVTEDKEQVMTKEKDINGEVKRNDSMFEDFAEENLKECERMNISAASESPPPEWWGAPRRPLPPPSPDVFTSTEEECTLTEVTVQKDTVSSEVKVTVQKDAVSSEVKVTVQKDAVFSEVKATDKPPRHSRLIEEMQKLDSQSGKLNLSTSHTSPFKHNNVLGQCASAEVTYSSSRTDPASEMKKRVSRKITDYFTKQPT